MSAGEQSVVVEAWQAGYMQAVAELTGVSNAAVNSLVAQLEAFESATAGAPPAPALSSPNSTAGAPPAPALSHLDVASSPAATTTRAAAAKAPELAGPSAGRWAHELELLASLGMGGSALSLPSLLDEMDGDVARVVQVRAPRLRAISHCLPELVLSSSTPRVPRSMLNRL
jgi:hypothetical protein